MSQADEYRASAEEARRKADLATDPAMRAQWLRLAEGWDELVRSREDPRAYGRGGR